MLDKLTIAQHAQNSTDDREKYALYLHFIGDFIAFNLKIHGPFDETVHRGKIVFERLKPHFEETKIADALINVPVNQIKLVSKELERQKWLFHDDQREMEVFIDSNAWEKYIDHHDQHSDKLIVGYASYINLHQLNQPSVHVHGRQNGSLAYAFVKLKFHNTQLLVDLPHSEFLDLVAYMKTWAIDYHHECNEPTFLRLKAEQGAYYEFLPEDLKKHVQPPEE